VQLTAKCFEGKRGLNLPQFAKSSKALCVPPFRFFARWGCPRSNNWAAFFYAQMCIYVENSWRLELCSMKYFKCFILFFMPYYISL